jgi:hypothetical protein
VLAVYNEKNKKRFHFDGAIDFYGDYCFVDGGGGG